MLLELCSADIGKDPLYGLLLTFGAALVIESASRVLWLQQKNCRARGDIWRLMLDDLL